MPREGVNDHDDSDIDVDGGWETRARSSRTEKELVRQEAERKPGDRGNQNQRDHDRRHVGIIRIVASSGGAFPMMHAA